MKKTLAAVFTAALAVQGPLAFAEPGLINLDNSVPLNPSSLTLENVLFGPGQRGGAPRGGGGGSFGGGSFGGGSFGGGSFGGGQRGGDRGRQEPPRQEPPRQEPPRQEPPRQEPPRQEPPRQEPPNRGGGDNRGGDNRGGGNRGGDNRGGDNRGGQKPPTWPTDPNRGGGNHGGDNRGGGQRPPNWPRPGRQPDGSVPAGHPQPPANRMPPVSRPPSNGGNNGQPAAPARIPQRPHPIGSVIDRNHRPEDALRNRPTVDSRGQRLTQREWTNSHGRAIPPSQTHITTINNTTVVNNITVIQNNWRGGNGYGWYHFGGYDVCHRYWGGYHWWGWYIGPVYFWAPYYAGYWWWYDPYWHRWCWYNEGYWWYQESPAVVYIYNETSNDYARYDDSTGGAVTVPDATPAVDTPPPSDNPAPAANPNEKAYHSADGMVTVQVYADGHAFIYSNANPPKFQPTWIGDNPASVLFRNDASGNVISVLVTHDDGTFDEIDANTAVNQDASSPSQQQAPAQDEPQTSDPNADGPQASLKASPSFGSLRNAQMTGYGW